MGEGGGGGGKKAAGREGNQLWSGCVWAQMLPSRGDSPHVPLPPRQPLLLTMPHLCGTKHIGLPCVYVCVLHFSLQRVFGITPLSFLAFLYYYYVYFLPSIFL